MQAQPAPAGLRRGCGRERRRARRDPGYAGPFRRRSGSSTPPCPRKASSAARWAWRWPGCCRCPEIQFRKYADPAHEQINDLGTLRWRTANHFAAPVVVRIPVGFGKKTGDPWHSVTGEAIYAHTLGWRIAFPSNAEDAVGLLRTALRGDDPTFFFEHRALLDTPEGRRPYPGDDFCLPFGKAARLLEGDELTVVTWGAMVPPLPGRRHGLPGPGDPARPAHDHPLGPGSRAGKRAPDRQSAGRP